MNNLSLFLSRYSAPTAWLYASSLAESVARALIAGRAPRSTPAPDIHTRQKPHSPVMFETRRHIATEGQAVEIHDGRVFVDGERRDEPYVRADATHWLLERAHMVA